MPGALPMPRIEKLVLTGSTALMARPGVRVAMSCTVSILLSRSCSAPKAVTEIGTRSEEHTSELQSLMRISYAVFCLTKQTTNDILIIIQQHTSQVKPSNVTP